MVSDTLWPCCTDRLGAGRFVDRKKNNSKNDGHHRIDCARVHNDHAAVDSKVDDGRFWPKAAGHPEIAERPLLMKAAVQMLVF